MKKILSTAFSLLMIFTFSACKAEETVNYGSSGSDISGPTETKAENHLDSITFPAYKEADDKINQTPKFKVDVDFPENWTVKDTKNDSNITVPGDFYSPLYIYAENEPIGYIGFNTFEPYEEDIPEKQYYRTVYPALRVSSFFHWDPYTAITATDTAETGIADIWYLDPEEIGKHPGATPDTPQLETIGILSYDKKLGVFIGIAFMPDTVTRAQAETIAQSVRLSPAA